MNGNLWSRLGLLGWLLVALGLLFGRSDEPLELDLVRAYTGNHADREGVTA